MISHLIFNPKLNARHSRYHKSLLYKIFISVFAFFVAAVGSFTFLNTSGLGSAFVFIYFVLFFGVDYSIRWLVRQDG